MYDRDSLCRVFLILVVGLGAAGCDSVPVTAPTGPVVQEAEHRTPIGTAHPMVLVPAGPFLMGSDYGAEDEKPVRQVHADAFLIDKFEVTNALYAEYTAATGRPDPIYVVNPDFADPAQPVVGVTWGEAQRYCAWAGLRLPTEAEWEKAARGEDGRAFPWGEEAPTPAVASYGGSDGQPAKVGTHPAGASPYGAHDMAGNVWEWTRDTYQPDFYDFGPTRNPVCTIGGDESDHALRGGGWAATVTQLRTAEREPAYKITGDLVTARIGFRCAKDAE